MTSETRGLAGNHSTATKQSITLTSNDDSPSFSISSRCSTTHRFPIPKRTTMPTPPSHRPARSMPNQAKAPIMISCTRHALKNPSSAIKNQITCLVNPYQATMPGNAAWDPPTQGPRNFEPLIVSTENPARQCARPERVKGQRRFGLPKQWAKEGGRIAKSNTMSLTLRCSRRHQVQGANH